jgi:hypothetical protein
LILLDELPDGFGRHGPRLAGNFASSMEQHEGGNAADTKALRQFGNFIDVDLGDEPLACAFGSDFVEFWRGHFAGAAPLGPKIDQDRQSGALGEGIELRFAFHVQRFGWEAQFGVTMATTERLFQPLIVQAIPFSALRTREQQAAFVEFNIVHKTNVEYKP